MAVAYLNEGNAVKMYIEESNLKGNRVRICSKSKRLENPNRLGRCPNFLTTPGYVKYVSRFKGKQGKLVSRWYREYSIYWNWIVSFWAGGIKRNME